VTELPRDLPDVMARAMVEGLAEVLDQAVGWTLKVTDLSDGYVTVQGVYAKDEYAVADAGRPVFEEQLNRGSAPGTGWKVEVAPIMPRWDYDTD
jgi:hypothetical protein